MVSSCREIVETAAAGEAAQAGARTRAMAALAVVDESSETAAKKMKVNDTSSELEFSSSSPRPYLQLRSQRRSWISQQKSAAPATEENEIRQTVEENRLPSHTSSSEASSSCCSRNGSSESGNEEVEFVDLQDEGGEVETSTCYRSRERRETTPSSEVVESTARPMSTEEVKCSSGLTAEKMPTESELEEFFAGPEKEIQKRFAEKYNYDIAKDKPLGEGRYEWVRLK